jgi:flagellar motor switch protein FliN
MRPPLLVSIEAEPVLRIVDRAFGGKGERPAPARNFPMAAELMIARLENLTADHLCAAVAATRGAPVAPASARCAAMAIWRCCRPLPRTQPLAVLTLEVDDGGVLPWLMTIAMPFATLARLLGHAEGSAPAAPAAPRRATDAPFADLPLTVSAGGGHAHSLFHHRRPGARRGAARVRRAPCRCAWMPPLRMAPIGTMDDRVAVQITPPFPTRGPSHELPDRLQPRGFDFLKDVDVRLSVELGRTDMKLKDVLSLGEESVVMLDRLTDELLDVMVNGKVIAKGEIVAQGNRFRPAHRGNGRRRGRRPPPFTKMRRGADNAVVSSSC